MTLYRGGWPFAGPPNTQFTLNTQSPQAKGLVGWWPTLGSRGANHLRDFNSGRFNSSTFSGPVWAIGPNLGPVLSFDGSDDYVEISDHADLTQQRFSIVQWFQWDGTIGDPFYRCPISKGIFSGSEFTVLFRVSTSDVELRFYVNNTERSRYTSTLNTSWHQYICTYDQAWTRIYFVGVQVDADNPGAISITDTANNIRLGRQTTDTYPWEGDLGDTRYYNRALSASEALHQYQNPWDLYQPVIPWALPIPLAAPPTPPDDKLPDKIRIARTYQIPIHQLQL